METSEILSILKRIPLFADLSQDQHNEIIKNITLQKRSVGDVIFKQGDSNTEAAVFIIKQGQVKITRKNPDGTEVTLGTLGENEFFGEMSLLTNEPRNATATVLAECEVCEIKKKDFLPLMESSPTLAAKISEEYVHRENKNSIPPTQQI